MLTVPEIFCSLVLIETGLALVRGAIQLQSVAQAGALVVSGAGVSLGDKVGSGLKKLFKQ